MTRAQEWDWPREPARRRRRYYRTVDVDGMPVAVRPDFKFTRLGDFKHPRCYQPNSGWNSPVAKKIVNAYWLVTITAIKMLIAVPLSLMIIGSVWLIWILLTL